jgi:hypothetical protein
MRSGIRVTIVGGRSVGSAPDCAADQARRLADAAGMALLEVHFASGPGGLRFVAANRWPDVSRPAVANALLDVLSV